ncbi:MAG: ribonuclease RnZ [Bacteroidetes bacterium HLUCCA01]|nr:MAG: ribonuclease RnZ [Bacteroidetes bacterium HLUCCA01]
MIAAGTKSQLNEENTMIVMPLGVGSATPTADRHLASVALWREGRIFLFDCGENAQMRMLQAGMKRSKIDYIFITHLDGDHFFGLPGLLTTMQLQRREKALTIVGPEGIKDFVEGVLKAVNISLCFELIFKEIKHGTDHEVVVEEDDFFIEARELKHNTYCVGYRLEEREKPGKVNAALASEMGITEDEQFKALKAGQDVELPDGTLVKASEIVGEPVRGGVFAYVTDTEFCENCIRLAENATILYHEATFGQALKDKATETGHCTAQEAAIVAKTANVERLVIGHFSARYTNAFVLLKEAKQVFEETWVATELRPVMTDPEQEKGIFKPVVPPQTHQKPDRGGRGGYQSGGRRPSGGGRQGGGGYRPRQGGSGGYRPRQGGGGSRYSNDRPPRRYDDRGGRPDYRDNRPPSRRYDDRGGDRPQRDYNYDNRRDYNRGGDYRSNDRPPRRYDDRGGRPDYRDNRDNRDYRGGSDRPPRDRDYNNRGRGPDNRDNRDNRSGRSDNPMPITPRTPFDEFDRF